MRRSSARWIAAARWGRVSQALRRGVAIYLCCAATAATAQPVRVEPLLDSRVLAPRAEIPVRVLVAPQGVAAGEPLDVTVAIGAGRDGEVLWRSDPQRVVAPAEEPAVVELTVRAPEADGCYRIEASAARPAGFANRLVPSVSPRALATGATQVAVIDPRRAPNPPGGWNEVVTLNPASSLWRDRTTEWLRWRRLPWRDGPSTGGGPVVARRVPGGKFLEVPPAPRWGEANWQGYPLPLRSDGGACLIEVELDLPDEARRGGAPAALAALAVLDAAQGGRVAPLGEAVLIEASRWNSGPGPTVARLFCRPHSQAPYLVVANASPTAPLRLGAVRVLEASPDDRTEARTPRNDDRRIALAWTGDSLAEAVGASRDAMGAADLQTHFEAARIAADRVELAGATGAYTPIASESLASEPGGFDPLEPLIAEFARRGLGVTPVLVLDNRSPEIAAVSDAPWVGADGGVGSDLPSILDPRTEQAIAAAIDRAVARYAGRPGVSGLAVRLGGAELLLGDEFGFDDASVDRFLASQNRRWPPAAPRSPRASADAIRARIESDWRNWRYERVAATLAGLPKRVAKGDAASAGLGAGELSFLADGLLQRSGLLGALRPRILASSDPHAALASLGLAPADAASRELAAPLPMLYPVTCSSRLADGGAYAWVADRLREAVEESPSAATVAQIVSPTTRITLTGSGRALFGADRSQDVTLRCVHAPRMGSDAALAEVAAAAPPLAVVDGSAARAGLIDDRAVEARRMLAASPPAAGESRSPAPDTRGADLVLHAYPNGDETIVTAVNVTPWAIEGQATLGVPQRTLAVRIASAEGQGEWFAVGDHALALRLAPYETRAWRFSAAGVEPRGVRERPSEEAGLELGRAVLDLRARDRSAHRAYPWDINASFEQTDPAGGVARWRTAGPNSVPAIGSTEHTRDGGRSLELRADNAPQGVLSDPFPAPDTGQLAVSFWTRGAELGGDSRLRLSIEQVDGSYRVHTIVPAERIGADPSWSEVVFAVEDLPLGGDCLLRLRLSLEGSGVAWIDGLEAEDLMLPMEPYADDLRAHKLRLVKLTHEADTALAEGRLADCRRVLDGYWPRFLRENFPLLEAEVAEEPASEAATPPPASPSVTERLRGYLPRWWR